MSRKGEKLMEEKPKIRKLRRLRSPPHPYFSLKDCVGFVGQLYQQDGLQQVHLDIGLKHMGLEPSSSVGIRALAALRGFGLLDEVGINKEIGLSRLAKSIILDKRQSSQERLRALRKAALNYEIIRDLAEKWSDGLPSDEAIETTLLMDKDFTKRAVSRFVGVLRDTYRYAELGKAAIMRPSEELQHEGAEIKKHVGVKMTSGPPAIQTTANRRKDVVSLIGGDQIIVDRPMSLSRRNYEIFVSYIKLMKAAWVAEEWAQDSDADGHATQTAILRDKGHQ